MKKLSHLTTHINSLKKELRARYGKIILFKIAIVQDNPFYTYEDLKKQPDLVRTIAVEAAQSRDMGVTDYIDDVAENISAIMATYLALGYKFTELEEVAKIIENEFWELSNEEEYDKYAHSSFD